MARYFAVLVACGNAQGLTFASCCYVCVCPLPPPTSTNFGPLNGGGPFINSITYGRTGIEYTVKDWILVSHTEISLITVPGVGAELSFIVTVAGQSSSPSETTMSYAAPVITDVSPSTVGTEAATTITITGTNFGLLDPTAFVTVMFGNAADDTLVRSGCVRPAAFRLRSASTRRLCRRSLVH